MARAFCLEHLIESVHYLLAFLFTFFLIVESGSTVSADPIADQQNLVSSYRERFPNVPADEYVHGVYAIDVRLSKQYDAINEFPPYSFDLDDGEDIAMRRNAAGRNIANCIGRVEPAGAGHFPFYDNNAHEIVTLALAAQRCLERVEDSKTALADQRLIKLLAFLNYAARGTARSVSLPETPPALEAYEAGKNFFMTKRGQLDLSCADCHVRAAGKRLRDQVLPPLLGAVNHFPVYGLRWGALGSLHQRFNGCLEQVRARPLQLGSRQFRELEYFLALMANGLPLIGPGINR